MFGKDPTDKRFSDFCRTGDPDALDPLIEALSDVNASVRAAAAAALGELGDPDAIPALKERRLDRSESVRQQIKETLARLTGAPGEAKPVG